MQKSDSNVDVDRIALDCDQSFVHIHRSTWHRRSPRICYADHALRLRTDLVDLDAAFADDCKIRVGQHGVRTIVLSSRTRAYQVIWNPELLNRCVRSNAGHLMMVHRRSRLRSSLAVHGILDSRPILVFEENSADIVDGDVNRVGHSYDGKNALKGSS